VAAGQDRNTATRSPKKAFYEPESTTLFCSLGVFIVFAHNSIAVGLCSFLPKIFSETFFFN